MWKQGVGLSCFQGSRLDEMIEMYANIDKIQGCFFN